MRMPVYYVHIDGRSKTGAELETDESVISCSSGDTVHFRVQRRELAAVVIKSHDAVLINFFEDADGMEPEMVQVVLRSKHSMSIFRDLVNATPVADSKQSNENLNR